MRRQLDTPTDLGDAIRSARRKQGLRQEDLALVSGTGLRFIGELEHGKATAHLGKTWRVLRALGLRIELHDEAEPDADA